MSLPYHLYSLTWAEKYESLPETSFWVMEAINHIWEREEELSDVVCSGTMASEKF